jgi:hypothetical protein
MKSLYRFAATVLVATAVLAPATAAAQSQRGLDNRSASAAEFWTPERRATAIPRDLVIDERGLGYIRGRGGQLIPHGHDIAAQAGPPGGGDTSGPTYGAMSPANGATVGASATLSVAVSDPSGVKSVSISVRKGTGPVQSFAASGSGGVWSVSLSGFTDGAWSWYAVGKDNAKPSNASTSPTVNFTVDTSGGGGGGSGDTVPNEEWTEGGLVQQAAGRIYFEMPANKRLTRWDGYVCSGTVATDNLSGRSIIITAAHCVYDDANKAFARNVLFIPNQSGTTGTGTDLNCANDPVGCWEPHVGVVDVNWTTRTFPNNVAWDYAYYVVNDVGAHTGNGTQTVLDANGNSMAVQFTAPGTGANDVTHALGYSYSEDPNFMYCADPMENMDAANWWLPNCGLSGGASGGPWLQPVQGGNGPIVSVNSWGYTTSPGMAGPKLSGTSAACIFQRAKDPAYANLLTTYADGQGVAITNCP